MSEPTLEALFERYRAQGELEALGAVFDRTAPELLALAAHLVRDPVEAEDLVQTTFVAAIEGARSFEGGRRLEPWLAGILARQAARAHRERGRTPDPARLERAAEADPLEHAERRELAASLARGLDELSAPYREVLERYLAGEKPLDIARAGGRAPGAVRMQILRGLERLRRILPAGLYGVVPLARAPRGLEALRVEVLGQGGLALAAGSAAVGSSVIGGLVVSTKVVLSLAAAAALALVFLLRSPRELEPHALVARAPSVAVPAPPPELAATAPLAREPERTPAVVEPPATAPGGGAADVPGPEGRTGVFLVGALLGLEGLDPTQVTIRAEGHGERTGHGTAEGRYAFEVTDLTYSAKGTPPALYVEAVHPAGRKVSLELPLGDEVREANHYELTELRLDLDLSPRTAIVGRVEVCEGVAAESVRVALVPAVMPAEGDEPPGFQQGVQCDERGGFALFPRQGGEYSVVARVWEVPPVVRRVRVAEREVADAGVFALEPGGATIEGVVRLPFEARLANFRVRAVSVGSSAEGLSGDWQGLSLSGPRIRVREGLGEVSAEGSFRIAGLEPGRHALQLEAPRGEAYVLPYPALEVLAPAANVVLGDSYGRTLARVTCVGKAPPVIGLEVRTDDDHGTQVLSGGGGTSATVITDRRKAFSVVASAPGWKRVSGAVPPPRALEERLELVLEKNDELASLELEWALAPGQPDPDDVTAHWRRDDGEGDASARSRAGRCRFENWAPGRYRVRLEPRAESWDPSASFLCTAPVEVELAAGRTTHATVEWTTGGRARFLPDASGRPPELFSLPARVVDAEGRALAVRFVQRTYGEEGIQIGSWSGAMALRGATELQPNLAPGGYELVLEEKGAELVRVPFTVAAGETVEVPFVVP